MLLTAPLRPTRASAEHSVLWAVAAALLLTHCAPVADRSEAEKRRRITQMYAEYETDFPDVPAIDATELAGRLERADSVGAAAADLVLLDVRPAEERRVSIIPGALSIEEFDERREELETATIVTYCTVGARSARLARDLQEAGFEVLNLRGSLLSWTHAGGELVDESGRPTRRLHVYGARWDLAAAGYDTVW